MLAKARPGPLGTSCLTCRRRHKKCDLRQPICKRCEMGRYECEGYGHNKRGPARKARSEASQTAIQDVSSSSRSISSGSELERVPSLPGDRSEDTLTTSSPGSFTFPDLSIEKSDSESAGDDSVSSLASNQVTRVEDYLRHFASQTTHQGRVGPLSILRKIINLQAQLPYYPMDPLKTFLTNPWFVDYLLDQFDNIMDHWYFKPVNYPRKRFRKDVVSRLQNSPFTRWIALIGMSVMESTISGDMSQDLLHTTWIGYIQGSLRCELASDLGPQKTQERRSDWIHVSVMKTMITHSSSTYHVLRGTAPIFLQVAFSDPTLWPNGCDLTGVPFSNILYSESHELAYFALLDCTYAMASGLPQQVEYDTTHYTRPIISSAYANHSSHQWAHSSPSEFQLVLADINACRDKSPMARDWEDIERWLLTWQSQPAEYEFPESWMTIGWYAVQESWRLALLAYLYMAVCGASSDDPRIQSCIKQILQVVGTIKKHGKSDANVSFFVQYLIVGICARSEAHRKVTRDRLLAPRETKLWLLRASDFVPVLDHLWHGAAAGGRPVKWEDYVRSREAVLPIVI